MPTFEPELQRRVVSARDETQEIATVEEWQEWAGPPPGRKHWAAERSAEDVAKGWLVLTAPSTAWLRMRRLGADLT
jgi:hypothetical protein